MIYFDYYVFLCHTFLCAQGKCLTGFTWSKPCVLFVKFSDGDMGIYFIIIIINYSLFMLQIFFCLVDSI